ncbi:unnamed protein product [Arabidopsis lyrata]|nr:unnamed protein product [Arabidopsis lyrata]
MNSRFLLKKSRLSTPQSPSILHYPSLSFSFFLCGCFSDPPPSLSSIAISLRRCRLSPSLSLFDSVELDLWICSCRSVAVQYKNYKNLDS